MENNMEAPQKVKIDLTYDQSILLLGIHPKEMKIFWWGICISMFITLFIILATWCEELTHLKRPWWCERLKVGGEGDDRGWNGWMASPTWWTWVWVDSGSWWWTGRPCVLWFMASQRFRQYWVTELFVENFCTQCFLMSSLSHLLSPGGGFRDSFLKPALSHASSVQGLPV